MNPFQRRPSSPDGHRHGLADLELGLLPPPAEPAGTPRHRLRDVLTHAVGAIVAHIANSAWGTNFWFLNAGSAGSPLEPIQAATGAFYVPALVAAVAIVWTLLYLPWVLRSRRPTAASGALG